MLLEALELTYIVVALITFCAITYNLFKEEQFKMYMEAFPIGAPIYFFIGSILLSALWPIAFFLPDKDKDGEEF